MTRVILINRVVEIQMMGSSLFRWINYIITTRIIRLWPVAVMRIMKLIYQLFHNFNNDQFHLNNYKNK